MTPRLIIRSVSLVALLTAICASSATWGALPALDRIVEESASSGGVLVHLGCGSGERSVQLRRDGRFVVQALDRDPRAVAAARGQIRSLRQYGSVSVNLLEGETLPYVDNLVNVLVVDDDLGITRDEMLRVLRPLGVAWVHRAVSDEWEKIVKPWPASMDEWTHFLHDASGNAVSQDETIGPPRRLQWTGGPLWTRSHEFNNSMPAMVTAQGRLFYIFDHGLTGLEDERLPEKWTLMARDAFNGSLLWQREMTSWGSQQWESRALRFFRGNMARRLVAEGDRVFVTFNYGEGVEILDGATGETLKVIPETEGSEEILVEGGQLFCLSQVKPRRPEAHVRITCYDLEQDMVAWQARDARYIPQLTSIAEDALVYHNTKAIVCLNRADGTERWRHNEKRAAGGQNNNMLLLADGKAIASSAQEIRALSLADGETVWTAPGSAGKSMRPFDVFVARGQVFANADGTLIAGYDLATGEKLTNIDPSSVQSEGHHLRCYRAKATENFLITQFRGVEFLSLDDNAPHTQNDWLRGSCTYGVMPANGFLYQPPHSCFCFAARDAEGIQRLRRSADGGRGSVTCRRPARRTGAGPRLRLSRPGNRR